MIKKRCVIKNENVAGASKFESFAAFDIFETVRAVKIRCSTMF